jgi:hypothetical protein
MACSVSNRNLVLVDQQTKKRRKVVADKQLTTSADLTVLSDVSVVTPYAEGQILTIHNGNWTNSVLTTGAVFQVDEIPRTKWKRSVYQTPAPVPATGPLVVDNTSYAFFQVAMPHAFVTDYPATFKLKIDPSTSETKCTITIAGLTHAVVIAANVNSVSLSPTTHLFRGFVEYSISASQPLAIQQMFIEYWTDQKRLQRPYSFPSSNILLVALPWKIGEGDYAIFTSPQYMASGEIFPDMDDMKQVWGFKVVMDTNVHITMRAPVIGSSYTCHIRRGIQTVASDLDFQLDPGAMSLDTGLIALYNGDYIHFKLSTTASPSQYRVEITRT